MNKLLNSLAIAATALTIGSAAQAATCNSTDTPNYSGFLTSNSGCELGSTNNDTIGGGTLAVNTDSLFGGGWSFSAKDDGVNGSTETTGPVGNFGFSVNGAQSGSWSFLSSLFSTYAEALIVQKGGRGSDQATYVGFLVTAADGNSGTYNSVFSRVGRNGRVNVQNISHMSLYVRGTPTGPGPSPTPAPVPLPAAGLMLLAGAGALGALRLKKRA